jgi:hypothetical protein
MEQVKLIKVHGCSRYAMVSPEDYRKVKGYRWRNSGKDYPVASIHGHNVFLHRFICGDRNDGNEVDHINRNTLDNRRGNLRPCTRQQNSWNTAPRRERRSRYKGVGYHKEYQMWTADLVKDGRSVGKQYHETEKEAALGYNELAKEHFGEFAFLNEDT